MPMTRVGAPGEVDAATPVSQQRRFRPDIQAMRALAVTLVVIFHLWPSALPGGYVGVDVFFVSTQISHSAGPAIAFSSFGVPFHNNSSGMTASFTKD